MESITLEQMYYIGEIIAAIAVIASLLYVGRQIQQNAEALQAGQRQAILAEDTNYLTQVINHPEITLAWTKPELTDEEVVKLRMALILFFRNRENDFAQYKRGVLNEADWQRYIGSLNAVLCYERIRNFWFNFMEIRLDTQFVEMVNDIIEKTPVAQGQIQDRSRRDFFESPEEYKRQQEFLVQG